MAEMLAMEHTTANKIYQQGVADGLEMAVKSFEVLEVEGKIIGPKALQEIIELWKDAIKVRRISDTIEG